MKYFIYCFLLTLLLGCAPPIPDFPKVRPAVETESVVAEATADAADDPALWIHPIDSSKSLIFGSNKTYGIEVFDLAGTKLATYEVGRVNNIDIRYDFPLNDSAKVDLLAGTERNHNQILVFAIDPETGALTELRGGINSKQPEVYGFCLYQSPFSGAYYAFLNDKSGTLEQWELSINHDSIQGALVRTFTVASQPEGMVADDKLGHLYVGEEGKGIWRFDADPQAGNEPLFLPQSGKENPNIRFDVEGLAIYRSASDSLLLASIQGNNSYAIFALKEPYTYLGSFQVADFGGIDGTEETDGIEVYSGSLGGKFTSGIFIAQDGDNRLTEGGKGTQNFKYIPWEEIATHFLPSSQQ